MLGGFGPNMVPMPLSGVPTPRLLGCLAFGGTHAPRTHQLILKPASPVASATRCTENANAHIRDLSHDLLAALPSVSTVKSSEDAHVRVGEAV
jgi:hypothetical protein